MSAIWKNVTDWFRRPSPVGPASAPELGSAAAVPDRLRAYAHFESLAPLLDRDVGQAIRMSPRRP